MIGRLRGRLEYRAADHVLIDVDANGNDIDIEGYNKDWHSFLSSDDLVEGRLQFTMTGDTTISLNENLSFDGIKTDSIGSRDRQFASDNQDILFSKHILTILQADGYYETADGRNVMLLPDLVADRATGELLKFNHVITLDISDTRLQNLGVTSNGLIDLNSDAPDAQDDHVSVDNESSIIIDVLANDFDPDGDVLTIDGFTNPYKGDLAMRDDGKLVYTPFGDYEGTDTFDYWTADDNGQLTRATVTVDVFDII